MSRSRSLMMAAVGLSLFVATIPVADPAYAQESDPVVTLEVESVNGSGCPTGSSVVTDVPDMTAFTLSFGQFKVYGGTYKSCVVSINVAVPAGWTYAVYEVNNRGYGILDTGASGRLVMNSWFTGFPWTLKADQTFRGPYDNFWQTTSKASSEVYAPCGVSVNLTLNDTLRVTGPSTSSMDLYAQDLRVSTTYRLLWKKC